MLTLLKALDGVFGQLRLDPKMAKQIYLYRVGIVTRSRDHMEFFGSNLLGTHRIWFKDVYVTEFFEGILDTPFDVVSDNIRKVTTINHTFKISGDVVNLTLMYLIHRFMLAPGLSDSQRQNAIHDLAMIFFYRCLCIIISDQFNFTADPKVAQQAYANLSMKFLIKKLGTWNKLIDYRAKALVDKNDSIHYKNLKAFDDDDEIVYAINDSQGRIKGIVKEYYSELVIVASGGNGVGINRSVATDMEGDEALREKSPGPEVYVLYIRSILMDKPTFVRDDILDIVSRRNSNASKRSVREVLEWMSDQSLNADMFKEIDSFVSKTMVLCVYYMNLQVDYKRRRDYVFVLKSLKDLFLSTRSVDPDLLLVREKGQVIVEKAMGKQSDSLMKATRTAVIIYLCLRAMVGSN